MQREERIFAFLGDGPARVPEIVAVLYAGIDKRLHGAAARTVAAHLIRLERHGRVVREGEDPLDAVWQPA